MDSSLVISKDKIILLVGTSRFLSIAHNMDLVQGSPFEYQSVIMWGHAKLHHNRAILKPKTMVVLGVQEMMLMFNFR